MIGHLVMADDGFPKELSGRAGFLLAQAHMSARRRADAALAAVGLTAKSFAALATVIGDGPISQRRLSERIRMDQGSMVAVIDGLEAEGHVVRRRNPADRREYALHATAKGRSLYARADRGLVEADNETLRTLDAAERRKLTDLLARVTAP